MAKEPTLRFEQRDNQGYVIVGCPDCGTETTFALPELTRGAGVQCSGCDNTFRPTFPTESMNGADAQQVSDLIAERLEKAGFKRRGK